MTYQQIKTLCNGKNLPIAAQNEDGENVIIKHGCDKWTYKEESWERNFFELVTAQHNGWTRHNIIFENGSTEEFYEMR